MVDLLAPKDEPIYYQGYADGWEACLPGVPPGEPCGAAADYIFGWWVGVGEAQAWQAGWAAAKHGQLLCPYSLDIDCEGLVQPWLDGYADYVMSVMSDDAQSLN